MKQLSDQYYRLIPHTSATAVIKSADQLKEKSSQLEALTDIEIAQRLLNEKVCPLFVFIILFLIVALWLVSLFSDQMKS